MVKSFKNHSKDRELDEFEEDLTRGKNLEEKITLNIARIALYLLK